ncbi:MULTISPECIES: phosphoribosyl-ATP diphosphatase [Sphingomonas]|jgi:phosphoribosyl-ATP pyrophosphohydrolase|uniref:Phosphoribosyl-ATP pyrophosphatase n=1 Tax=Sphingomonas hankookensis TaxID=563996 RepID=A0ABR5YFJ2_9SPHN|nr:MULTISPECIES: phosphoribosyl-ATP diphosphatase [Sphingomonas]KZE18082.1 phosphoribosyl-ATP pyrophosphatase [Sphingomonas hankookensis]PZT93460.1 MAG: phosphoribosyl-ATP diphosphatase [Sphingomonas sp.]RSV31994.1 phosphoribosyl-ATP diphosphatase [Sphingomonas sp. ABOLH]WCP71898.1 phosphoribosyl-ATP diphosphatase [Sphingomonas hankookensis]
MDAFDRLESVIASRIGGDPTQSYVAKLHARGTAKIAQKVGEEAVECVIAACGNDRAGLIGEAADLIFHLTLLLQTQGIALDDVRAELTRRDGLSGIAEKASRPKE